MKLVAGIGIGVLATLIVRALPTIWYIIRGDG